jgi:hypothetical protein
MTVFKVYWTAAGEYARFAGREVAEESSEAAYSHGLIHGSGRAFVVHRFGCSPVKIDALMAWSPELGRYWPGVQRRQS